MVTNWTATFCRNGRVKIMKKSFDSRLGRDPDVCIEQIIERFKKRGWFVSAMKYEVVGCYKFRNI